jgi:hypothetical protein
MKRYWVTCARFTIQVDTDDDAGLIRWTAPIARCFVGQRFIQLLSWARAFGDLRYQELDN